MKKIGSSQRIAAAFCGTLAIFLLRSNLNFLEYPLVWWVIIITAMIVVESGIIALVGFSLLLRFSQNIGLRGTYWLGWLICLAALSIVINSVVDADWLMIVLSGIFTLALFWVFTNMVGEFKKGKNPLPHNNIFYILLIFVAVAVFVFIRSQQIVLLMPSGILASSMGNITLVVLLSAIMSRE